MKSVPVQSVQHGRRWSRIAAAGLLALGIAAVPAAAAKKTVCTITVNSADEKDTFRASLSPDKYQFVELVERGRDDWLDSACRRGIQCDVLVISGHYDGGNEFFSEKVESREFLPVAEMERVSCSDSCPGLFSSLKEVYLFGCNTLNGEAVKHASSEIGRSLVRSGHSKADAERIARSLSARHGESSRDRMRQIFNQVPAIYGFSSVAPLGPNAAATLRSHFNASGTGEVGSGRASARLLGRFAANSMVVTSGLTESDPQAAHRRDVCQFADERVSPAQRVDFVHALLNREAAESRMFLDRIEKYASTVDATRQTDPAVAEASDRLAGDRQARARFLDLARDADEPSVRGRMLLVAQQIGWLSAPQRRDELLHMIRGQLAGMPTAADVDLACTLNSSGELDGARERGEVPPAPAGRIGHAAILACLGSVEDRVRVLEALTNSGDAVEIAQTYLRHRPLAGVDELRGVATGIGRMNGVAAKVRALETLARHQVSDPRTLDELARLFPRAESASVQLAIAGVLIRSNYDAVDRPELVQTLRQHRIKSTDGADVIDALIRRLQLP